MSYPQTSFFGTEIARSSFLGRRREVVRKVTLKHQLQMLRDTGRYDAFRLKWHPTYDEPPFILPIPRHLSWDSDIGKWLEAACYFLHDGSDPEVEKAILELVDMIAKAQQPDGYLNIHYMVVAPGKRFTDLRDFHELYNAGHLVEAALAHHQYFRNNDLLGPMLKYMELFIKTFGRGPDQIPGYPGHSEIELALFRLYDVTHDRRHLDLGRYFITERGNPKGMDGQHYYDVEAQRRGEHLLEMPEYYSRSNPYRYQQAHQPLLEQETIEGHSVRGMYLLIAVAELCQLDKQAAPQYLPVLRRLWENMVGKKMYLTGGIGAIAQWEGFGIDYFLPHGTDEGGCYAETCASIGVIMLAERLLQLDLKAEYADIMELCLYNAVLTGMSHDGKSFTYTNQLASSDSDPSKRESWFGVSCCPPNVARLLGSIGGYAWTCRKGSEGAVTVDVHLYATATLSIKDGDIDFMLKQETEWPADGRVRFLLETKKPIDVTCRLRIPGWSQKWQLDPPLPDIKPENGYIVLSPEYLKENQAFELSVESQPRLISPHPYTNQNVVAVARGPLIFCLEDPDHEWVDDHFKSMVFDPSKPLQVLTRDDVLPGETVVAVQAIDAASFLNPDITGHPVGNMPFRDYQTQEIGPRRATLNFIPYYARANRPGKGQMTVGLRLR